MALNLADFDAFAEAFIAELGGYPIAAERAQNLNGSLGEGYISFLERAICWHQTHRRLDSAIKRLTLRDSPAVREKIAELQIISISPSSTATQPFPFNRLPLDMRFMIYDEICDSDTFRISSKHARGTTFSNLAIAYPCLEAELDGWADSRPIIDRMGGNQYLNSSRTTFLLDFWSDRAETSIPAIQNRFVTFTESTFNLLVEHLCIDIRILAPKQIGAKQCPCCVMMLRRFKQFPRLRTIMLILDSGDGSGKDLYSRVWGALPTVLGFCDWSTVCTCCSVDKRPELRAFDVQSGLTEELVALGGRS